MGLQRVRHDWATELTDQPGEFIFQCPIFLPFHTVPGVLKARILKWFAIPFSSGPHCFSFKPRATFFHNWCNIFLSTLHVALFVMGFSQFDCRNMNYSQLKNFWRDSFRWSFPAEYFLVLMPTHLKTWTLSTFFWALLCSCLLSGTLPALSSCSGLPKFLTLASLTQQDCLFGFGFPFLHWSLETAFK